MSEREVLSGVQIKTLLGLLRTAFDCVSDLRKRSPLANSINFPKLPSALTESLVVHLIRQGVILPEFAKNKLDLGGMADVVVEGGRVRIEVKGTTMNSWVTLGKKDIRADYLVWIHFGDYFTALVPKRAEVYVFKSPGRYLKLGKPVLNTVVRKAGPNASKTFLDTDEFLRRV